MEQHYIYNKLTFCKLFLSHILKTLTAIVETINRIYLIGYQWMDVS